MTISNGVVRQSDIDKNDTSNSDKSKYKLVKPNDLVYNKMRMWQGSVGLSNYNGIVSPAYIVISPNEKVNPRYFHYLLRSTYYVNYSKRFSYGLCDDQLSLRYTDFKRMYSIVPPIQTQSQIVEILEFVDSYFQRKLQQLQKAIGRKIIVQSNAIENSLYDTLVWYLVSGQLNPASVELSELEIFIDKLFLAQTKKAEMV